MSEHQHDARRIESKPPRKTEDQASSTNSDPVLKLQGLIGNQAVQRLMKQGSATLASGKAIQAKLTVTSADNASEREADSVADQVMQRMGTMQRQADEEEVQTKRMPDIAQREPMPEEEDMIQGKRDLNIVQREPMPEEEDMIQGKRDPNIVQRAAPEEEEVQTKRDLNIVQRDAPEEEVQAKEESGSLANSFEVTSDIEQSIEAQRGGGQAMPANVQRSLEGAFGADFSGVRIHTDTESNALNESVGARAFTTGSDIFFKEGEYQPETSAGQHLLAHELTHTIQQNAVERRGGK